MQMGKTGINEINVPKCKVMHTGPRNTNCSYFMNGQLLNSVTEHNLAQGPWRLGLFE